MSPEVPIAWPAGLGAVCIALIVVLWRTSGRKAQAAGGVSAAEERLQRLVASVRDCAFFMLDPNGLVVTWNDGAQAIKGYTEEEVVGRNFAMFYPEEEAADGAPGVALETARAKGKIEVEGWRVRKDGRRFWAHVAIVAIFDGQGDLLGFSNMTRDLTERRRAQRAIEQSFEELQHLQTELEARNRELERETERAREASRLKSEFLANMSHELRTPLNGILGFSELLIDEKAGPITADQREFMADIHSCGRHLLGLINNLLDLAKVEAGKMEMVPEEMSLTDNVDQVTRTLLPMARQKEIALEVKLALQHATATLDPRLFRQILYNLLANAIKFTEPKGRVRLTVSDAATSRIEVQVSDTGIGMSAEEVERLFVPFQQLDSGLGRRHQGSGLGLALTRRFSELSGGSIRVESEKGKGTTFTVTLPRVAVAAA